MKKILIAGAKSYIGTSFEKWCLQHSDIYLVNTIDMKNNSWKDISFLGYDTVFHVAAIVHLRERKDMRDIYFAINRDLAVNVAIKAKSEGVRQFIFLSTMAVYSKDIKNGIITKETEPSPETYYGKSKLQAEKALLELQNSDFGVSVLRLPMVYGKGCRGNYSKLEKFAKMTPIFPDFDNKRSMICIHTLCEFVGLQVIEEKRGVFFPQDEDYINTTELVRKIAKENNHTIIFTKIFNPFIKGLRNKVGILNKIFGDLVYEY